MEHERKIGDWSREPLGEHETWGGQTLRFWRAHGSHTRARGGSPLRVFFLEVSNGRLRRPFGLAFDAKALTALRAALAQFDDLERAQYVASGPKSRAHDDAPRRPGEPPASWLRATR